MYRAGFCTLARSGSSRGHSEVMITSSVTGDTTPPAVTRLAPPSAALGLADARTMPSDHGPGPHCGPRPATATCLAPPSAALGLADARTMPPIAGPARTAGLV